MTRRDFDTSVAGSFTCPDCGKRIYWSRKDARAAAKKYHPGHKMRAYRCDHDPQRWHYGHPEKIRKG